VNRVGKLGGIKRGYLLTHGPQQINALSGGECHGEGKTVIPSSHPPQPPIWAPSWEELMRPVL